MFIRRDEYGQPCAWSEKKKSKYYNQINIQRFLSILETQTSIDLKLIGRRRQWIWTWNENNYKYKKRNRHGIRIWFIFLKRNKNSGTSLLTVPHSVYINIIFTHNINFTRKHKDWQGDFIGTGAAESTVIVPPRSKVHKLYKGFNFRNRKVDTMTGLAITIRISTMYYNTDIYNRIPSFKSYHRSS